MREVLKEPSDSKQERKEVKGMKRFLLLPVIAVTLTLFYAAPSMAVHKGAGDLTCGNCHTMHNSQGGQDLEGASGGSLVLLRGVVTDRSQIHNFCLQCHASNGSQASTQFNGYTPPKVYIDGAGGKGIATSNTDPFNFTDIGAGGDFSAVGTYSGGTFTLGSGDGSTNYSLGYGHSLGAENVVPPGAEETTAITDFTCTNCHDPHGTAATTTSINAFRNLRVKPVGGAGGMLGETTGVTVSAYAWVGGSGSHPGSNQLAGRNATASNHIWPIAQGDGTAQPTDQNYYYAGSSTNGVGDAGISGWCAQCHDKWHEEIATTNNADPDWRRHPVDNALVDGTPNSGAGVPIVDWNWYNTNTDSRAPNTSTYVTKLPAAQADATGTTYYADDSGDKVFCLSCHYAHGGPNYDALRWDYLASVGAGSQTGNGVPDNVGCQQCHKR